MPATNPQKIDLMSGRGRQAVELLISWFSRQVVSALPALYIYIVHQSPMEVFVRRVW